MNFLDYIKLQEKLNLADQLGLTSKNSSSEDVTTVVTSSELEKYKTSKPVNSAAVIKDALDKSGLGLEKIRQTKTKENTSTVIYKKDGFSIDAVWLAEDGPMDTEGYSKSDGLKKLKDLVSSFESMGGVLLKMGSIKENSKTILNFDNEFKIIITPLILNSALDGSGFNRTFITIETE